MTKDEREKEISLTHLLRNLPSDIKINPMLFDHINRYMSCQNEDDDDENPITNALQTCKQSELIEIKKIQMINFLEKRLYEFCHCNNGAPYFQCCAKQDLKELQKYLEKENCNI